MVKTTGSISAILFLLSLASLALTLLVDSSQNHEEREDAQNLIERAAFNRSVTKYTQYTIQCDGGKYGDDLQLDSCQGAMSAFPDNRKAYTFGPPNETTEFITPLRILSRK